jgi:hypothetical protein
MDPPPTGAGGAVDRREQSTRGEQEGDAPVLTRKGPVLTRRRRVPKHPASPEAVRGGRQMGRRRGSGHGLLEGEGGPVDQFLTEVGADQL